MIGITQAQIETKQASLISHQYRGLWKQLGTAPHPTSSSRWSVLRAKFRRRTSSCWMPRIACETKTSYLSRNDYNIFGEKIDSDGHDTSSDLKYGFLYNISLYTLFLNGWMGWLHQEFHKKQTYQAVKHVSNHRFSKCKNRNAHRVVTFSENVSTSQCLGDQTIL